MIQVDAPRQFPGATPWTTRYDYDGLDNLKSITSPDTGITNQTFDDAGNVKTKTYPRTSSANITTTYQYDALNRVTKVDYPTNIDTTLVYDETNPGQNGKGHLTTLSDESGSTTYKYDLRGNLLSKTTTITGFSGGPFVTQYEYDSADKVKAVVYPSGRRVNYLRDATGRIQSVTMTPLGGIAQPIVSNATYAPFGPPTGFTLGPSNIVATYSFDLSYRPQELNYQRSGNFFPIMDARTPVYDAADNPLFENQAGPSGNDFGGRNFSYDWSSRISGANWPESECCSSNVAYLYDPNGNRKQAEYYRPGNNPTHPNYDLNYESTSNRLLSITLNPSSSGDLGLSRPSYQYDAAGNVKTITPAQVGATPLTINYGENNRPTMAINGSLLTTSFTHNGLEQRVAILNTGGSMQSTFPSRALFYDEAGHVLAERRANGWAYEYIYLDNQPVAFVYYSNTTGGGTPTVYYFETDHLGMPRYATDSVGNGVWYTYMTEPFRNNWDIFSAYGIAPGLRFPGQYYLPEIGMYYNYFRDYDPTTGRYLQSDPIGLQGGINPYAYVENNPVGFVDPSGLYTVSFGGGLSFQHGGAGFSFSAYVGQERGKSDNAGRICTQVTSCGRVGPGESAGATGSAEIGEGSFCEGNSASGGIFAEKGFGVFEGFEANSGTQGKSASTSFRGGTGYGKSGGSQACVTRTICFP